MREFTKDRETVRDRKHSVRPLLVTEELKNVSAISLQMINASNEPDCHFLQNLRSCLVDNASQETMI